MVDADTPREFAFELALCAHLEESTEWVVGRQLGAAVDRSGRRIVDVVGVVPGPDFERRARITDRAIPVRAVESDVGVGERVPRARTVRDSEELHDSVVESAVEAGFFATERRGGREYLRQTTRYPREWFRGLVGIENKPDLGEPGALGRQLRTDVSLGLFEEVVLATASHVTRAHLNRIPDEVGVWRFDPESGAREVIREAAPLSTDAPGVELVAERPLRTEIELVDRDAKERARTRVAERAYGKGWRTYDLPACEHAAATADGRPYCAHFDRVVDPARVCGGGCRAYDPGSKPDVDGDDLRDERTPWRRDPPGVVRRQSGLDRFG
ncbi:DUF5787 family protein [Halobellus limi]|uniref:Uncharacterized protein n=1 Tax=Halobellus limi TaxID=699433 RepID=A0A1H5W4J5_9EURY|nr:DUF5787 family protein [Halobellus limi]QCC48825.1 hypothetical protein DV707_01970 [Halobellus limi]SEF94340.1 hypothetical protein SAMN04488133_1163 [Halobellus limi]